MSSNEFLVDATTRHQVFIQSFADHEINKLSTSFLRVEQDLILRLSKARTPFQVERLSAQLKDVREFISATYRGMSAELITDMQEFGIYEADFANRMMVKATPVGTEFVLPSNRQITSAVFSTPMTLAVGDTDKKVTIKQALKQFETKKAREAVLKISDGFLAGKTNAEIVRDVQDVIDIQRRHGEALVRTITNHTASQARERFYEENTDVIDKERWVSTLDFSTTKTCAKLDGEEFPVGVGPQTPRHWKCRSLRTPIVKPEYNIGASIEGDRPAKGATGPSQVGAKTTFSGWFRTQPASFQKEYLGPGRYDLFSKGGLSIKKFADKDGNVYSLAQLKKLEPVAFAKADA